MRKASLFLSVAVLFMTAIAGCKKNDNSTPTTASVVFFNGTAGTTNVDISVNNTKLTNASNLAFLKATSYQSVTPGNDSITFVLTNLGTPLKNAKVNLVANTRYSVYTGGLITGPIIVSSTDDLSAPASGNAKIRFVNLSTDAMSVTANVGATAIATGVAGGGISGYTQVAAGSYVIKAGDPANIATVVTAGTGAMSLASGRIYTVILTGTLSGTSTSALTLTVINNN
jgi:hypothetical protein